MDNTKLYLCFEATNPKAESSYLIYSAEVSDLMTKELGFIPDFTFENSIRGASSMGCGLFNSKIVLAGGFSGAGEETEYNRGLITYDTVSKEVDLENIPAMLGRKVRPLVFELNGRLFVMDTSDSVYKRTCEVYYPTIKMWGRVRNPFCNTYNARSGSKHVSGRTPFSWFINGKTVSISSPTEPLTFLHHASQYAKCFSVNGIQKLPFDGMAITYWEPGDFYDVVVISFTKGEVGGQGYVQGRRLRYTPVYFSKPQLLFLTDPYEEPAGEVSSYFAECGNGKFCLTTFDNVNIHVYVFKISRKEGVAGPMSLVLHDYFRHKYKFNDFSHDAFTCVSISGCFVLPRDDGTKRSEESKMYDYVFSGYELEVEDDDLPSVVKTDEGFKLDPQYEYDSGGADSDFGEC